MPDKRVVAIAEHWGPRLLANGVDAAALEATLARIDVWDDWLPAWVETGDGHAAAAARRHAESDASAAGEAWRQAALAYHFARFNWPLSDERARDATHAAAAALSQALARLDPGAERVEVPFEGAALAGVLRRPPGVPSAPLVVLLGGFDSAKEEFTSWEGSFLARELATLSLDGPGQGETALALPARADFERAVSAALDGVTDRVDTTRVGIAGVSLGGLYAIRAAAADPRAAAVAAISAPYDLGTLWAGLRGILKLTFADRAGGQDAAALAARLTVADAIADLPVPVLVVVGARDRVIAPEETRRIAAAAPRGRLVELPDGNHACNNAPSHYRPLVASWIADTLRDG